jgi:hypothetical protein
VDQSDILQTLAEIAVAFAGFSGVVAVFGRSDPANWSFADRMRFRTLIRSSLFAAFFCALPFCLFALHLSEEAVWRTASTFFAVYLIYAVFLIWRSMSAATPAEVAEISRPALTFLILMNLVGLALNLYNAAALGELGPFLLAVLLLLSESGFLFARMLLLSFGGERGA